MGFSLPQVGDTSGYIEQGGHILDAAKLAVQGDAGSIASLLQMGVYLAAGADKSSTLLSVAASTVSAGATGFLVGGPVGAAVGALGALADQLSGALASQGTPAPQAIVSIMARQQAWNERYSLSDTNGHPQGWALYDYIARTYPPTVGDLDPNPFVRVSQAVCTPYLWPWAADPSSIAGCDTQSGGFAGPSAIPLRDYLTGGDAMSPPPGTTAEQIVAQAEQHRPPSRLYGVDELGFQVGRFGYIVPSAKLALGLSTVFGLLQVGASPVSVAAELMVQYHHYAALNYHDPPGPSDPDFQALVDYYVGLAHAEQGTGTAPGYHIVGTGFNRGLVKDATQQGPAQTHPTLQRPAVKAAIAGAGLAALAVAAGKGLLGSTAQDFALKAWRRVAR